MKTLVAFYSQSGQTKKYAQLIAEKMGADLYEIIPERKYNNDMWKAWDEAQVERNENNYPALRRLPAFFFPFREKVTEAAGCFC